MRQDVEPAAVSPPAVDVTRPIRRLNERSESTTSTHSVELNPYKTVYVSPPIHLRAAEVRTDESTGGLLDGTDQMQSDRLEASESFYVSLEEEDEWGSVPPLLTLESMEMIARAGLPLPVKHSKWTRIYNTNRDGASFHTFLHNVQKKRRTLLVVRTKSGAVFGAYVEHPWAVQSGYFGTGETFLYSVVDVDPLPADHLAGADERDAGGDNDVLDFVMSQIMCLCFQDCHVDDDATTTTKPPLQEVQIHNWTGANRYFQLCNLSNERIAIGGGGNSFGICLEGHFETGSTGPCDTFGNPPLTEEIVFDVNEFEVYAIESSIC